MKIIIKKAVGGKEVRAGISTIGGQCRSIVTYDAPNDPSDVIKVQQILNQLQITVSRIRANGLCEKSTVDAIREFQKWFGGTIDGRVDPGGKTIQRLNELSEPMGLEDIKQTHPKYGAYSIRYKTRTVPKEFRVLLLLTEQVCLNTFPGSNLQPNIELNSMDVTDHKKKSLLNKNNIATFMTLIDDNKLWGRTGSVRLLLIRNRKVVSISTDKSFAAPVQPYAGALTPWDIGKGDSGPKMKYVGTGSAPFIGRYFYDVKIGDKYFWKYGSNLVTNNDHRGFDCITFVGSCFALSTVGVNPYLSSANMASALNATYINWEKSSTEKITNGVGSGKLVKAFFAQSNKTGTFLLWKGSHIVLVHNKEVYEFAASKKGFVKTALTSWVGNSTSYHVCSLPTDKQF